ncbi:MAG: leucine-rich repeat domain-containing protein [Porphyromonadaceae bacterium]|nr:MAG: leucine-rich repeat domain-containing protein [Porphyromonadaceae bacterium]
MSLTSVIYNAENCEDFPKETFKDCNLTSLVIGENVKCIPSYLAYDQKKLTSITIPKSVNYIGEFAFSGCSGLASVIIGENVADIRSGAFANCSSLTSVIFNAENCSDFSFTESPFKSGNLTTLIIGEGVKHIPSYLAYNQKNITDITIPNSVTSIGSSAFFGCSGLKGVNISDIAAWCGISFSNEESNPFFIFQKHLYVNGSEIHDLLIPKSVSSIGDFCFFYGCSSLKSIHIQGSVSSVGTHAFFMVVMG